MGEVQDALEAHLKPLPGPFLFVGAGLTRRFAGLPNWEGLLREFAKHTPKSYEYYFGLADGDLPKTASFIAADFYEVWWKSATFKESKEKNESSITEGSSALKIEISQFVAEQLASSSVPSDLLDEWNLLRAATIDGAITTNYDGLLSLAFPDFEVFVGQDELLFSDTQGIAEIYHIHGAATDPGSLVLTDADYLDYAKHNPYLAAKLLTIFVEHPVIFLGYSLGDKNIQAILQSIVFALRAKNVSKLQDRLIFVEWQSAVAPSISESVILVEGVSIPITRVIVPDFLEVFGALGARPRAIPGKMVRLLKEQIYELILTNDPQGRLVAYSDVDSASAENMSVVFGVGAKAALMGIVGLNRAAIFADVLSVSGTAYPAKEVLDMHIGQVRITDWYPVFRYLAAAGHLTTSGHIRDESVLPPKVVGHAKRTISKVTMKVRYRRRVPMAKLLDQHDWKWILTRILELPSYTNDVEGLREFLVQHADKESSSRWGTDYAKGVVVYDLLKFGPNSA
ncbi:SIR2 family protein [Rathayibacter sp. VKM Ac-2754]|uniref:SIR2 family protein n=1 Tax=Rathayibacter sp. VKM Ac-2754 TaxID=2609251 RepID=UPI00135CA718|nr:SIR2 family protein [Rathayibacter sp. VKM Ac-2754]MWV57440.1 hypothetical protein [Rathayibacter sp. VKM Ac-2754]